MPASSATAFQRKLLVDLTRPAKPLAKLVRGWTGLNMLDLVAWLKVVVRDEIS